MNIVIKGDTKSGKTTLLRKKYVELIKDKKIDSSKILVLVANRLEAINFKNNLSLSYSNENRIHSYFGFVQKELYKFWPLVLEKSKKISKLNIVPTFMTFEASQCLMGKTVEFYRKKGYLSDINTSDEEISKKLLSNVLDASLNNILYTKIGSKLEEFAEFENREIYKQMNEIIDKYMEKTLESGTFDYGTSIYLYNNVLLKDDFYLNKLKENTEYLILDSMEIAPTAEIDFVKKIHKSMKEIIVSKNTDGPYGIYSYNMGYLESKLLEELSQKQGYKEIDLTSQNIEKLEKEEFLDKFEENLYSNKEVEGLENINLDIENEYKSENNRVIIKKVLELLDRGINPKDISVITPQNDVVLEFALQKIATDRGFKFMNVGRNERVLDNPYAYILIISSILFYRFKQVELNFDELKVFFIYSLNIDPIRASLLTNHIGASNRNRYELLEIRSRDIRERISEQNIMKYDKIRGIFENTSKNIDLNEFFEIMYKEVLSQDKDETGNVRGARELIDSSKKFIDTLRNFDNIKDINYEFVKFLRVGAKASESLVELDERLEGEYLSLSTPYGYINSGRESKYQIWTDVRNKNFIPNTKNILQNSWVLSKTWKGHRFSLEDEFEIEKSNTMGIIKRLIKSCSEEIYIFGSKYSSGSQDQRGLLYKGFKKIKK